MVLGNCFTKRFLKPILHNAIMKQFTLRFCGTVLRNSFTDRFFFKQFYEMIFQNGFTPSAERAWKVRERERVPSVQHGLVAQLADRNPRLGSFVVEDVDGS